MTRQHLHRIFFCTFAAGALATGAAACTEAGDPYVERTDPVVTTEGIEFDAQIRPIFDAAGCYTCHQMAFLQGNLELESLPGSIPSGDGGAVLEPCNGDTSLLYLKLVCDQGSPLVDGVDCSTVTGDVMPTTGALDQDRTSAVKQWIDEGAAAAYDPNACP